jgi:L-lysine 6-transaminase
MNVSRSNKFNLVIDFDKSKNLSLYDKNTDRFFLDFVGMFASLPLGYNHAIFQTDEFKDEILRVSHTKVTNCFMGSDESREFDEAFCKFAPKGYDNIYYCCTGSLAVESAIKAALETNTYPDPKVVTFGKSFHGLNGWASFVTSRDYPVGERMGYAPSNFVLECKEDIESLRSLAKQNNICAVLIEPIRATHGDIYFDKNLLQQIDQFCHDNNIILIVDEVQTGMGVTGTWWYHEQLGITPDIIVFGKKSQLSGIMANERASSIFKQKEKKLEVTWDANLIDMIRCKYILKAYDDTAILENVKARSKQLTEGLSNPRLKNIRSAGLLVGFDLESEVERNEFQQACYDRGLLINSGGEKSIRLRPSLSVNYNEIEQALSILNHGTH